MPAGHGGDRELVDDPPPGGGGHRGPAAVGVGPLVEDRPGQGVGVAGGGEAAVFAVGDQCRGCRGSPRRPAGAPGAIASSKAMLIPSSREGRTNRSAARRARARVGPRRRAARRRRPIRAARSAPRVPAARGLRRQREPGRRDARSRTIGQARTSVRGPSRARAGRRRRRGGPLASRAADARAPRGRGRRWAGRDPTRVVAGGRAARRRPPERSRRPRRPAGIAAPIAAAEPPPALPGEVPGRPRPLGPEDHREPEPSARPHGHVGVVLEHRHVRQVHRVPPEPAAQVPHVEPGPDEPRPRRRQSDHGQPAPRAPRPPRSAASPGRSGGQDGDLGPLGRQAPWAR